MLTNLFNSEINRRRISYRAAAREIGIAHTTAVRIRDGHNVDLSIIRKVADWLHVDQGKLVSVDKSAINELTSKPHFFLRSHPEIEGLLNDCVDFLRNYSIPAEVVDDIRNYVEYRRSLSQKGGRTSNGNGEDTNNYPP